MTNKRKIVSPPMFTTQEEQIIDSILQNFSNKARYPLTLYQLIDKWSQFGSDLEMGYFFLIYDYQNDLSTREILQEIIAMAPESIQEKILRELLPIDKRFQQLTREMPYPILGDYRGWWWYRIPRKTGHEFY